MKKKCLKNISFSLNFKGDNMTYKFEVLKWGSRYTYEFKDVQDLVKLYNELEEYLKDNTFTSVTKFCGSFGTVFGDKCIVTDNEIFIYNNNTLVFQRNRHESLWVRGFYSKDYLHDSYMIIYDNKMVDNNH